MQEEAYGYYSQTMSFKEPPSSHYMKPQRRQEPVYHQRAVTREDGEDSLNQLHEQPVRISKMKFRREHNELQERVGKKVELNPIEEMLDSLFEQEKAFRSLEMEIKLTLMKKEMLTSLLEKSKLNNN